MNVKIGFSRKKNSEIVFSFSTSGTNSLIALSYSLLKEIGRRVNEFNSASTEICFFNNSDRKWSESSSKRLSSSCISTATLNPNPVKEYKLAMYYNNDTVYF